MRISVIIPTYNGRHKIGNVLRAVLNQTAPDFELIVVIDGSTDDTEAVIAGLLATDAFHSRRREVKVIVQPNGGRAAARNRGAREAAGALLVFFDDDMRPEPDCVEVYAGHHLRVKNSIAVGVQMEDTRVMKTDIQRYKAGLSRKWLEPLKANNGLMSRKQPFITAANFSISRELFFGLGGFDEQLSDAEDYDLAVRAGSHGVPIYFKAEALAWHDDFITCRSYVKRLGQYREAHRKLLRLKPDLYRSHASVQPYRPGLLKALVYRFFGRPYWAALIDKDLPVAKLIPGRVRYKLYDIITTGLSTPFSSKRV